MLVCLKRSKRRLVKIVGFKMEHHTADLNVLRTRVCLIVDNICKNALQEYNRERSSSTEAGSPCFDLGRRTVDSITELVMLYACKFVTLDIYEIHVIFSNFSRRFEEFLQAC